MWRRDLKLITSLSDIMLAGNPAVLSGAKAV
jgi:hypothetical protein